MEDTMLVQKIETKKCYSRRNARRRRQREQNAIANLSTKTVTLLAPCPVINDSVVEPYMLAQLRPQPRQAPAPLLHVSWAANTTHIDRLFEKKRRKRKAPACLGLSDLASIAELKSDAHISMAYANKCLVMLDDSDPWVKAIQCAFAATSGTCYNCLEVREPLVSVRAKNPTMTQLEYQRIVDYTRIAAPCECALCAAEEATQDRDEEALDALIAELQARRKALDETETEAANDDTRPQEIVGLLSFLTSAHLQDRLEEAQTWCVAQGLTCVDDLEEAEMTGDLLALLYESKPSSSSYSES